MSDVLGGEQKEMVELRWSMYRRLPLEQGAELASQHGSLAGSSVSASLKETACLDRSEDLPTEEKYRERQH